MPRNYTYSALVLRSRPAGESNRELWLLSAEAGLIKATMFGGPKSKLRAYAMPFNSGQAWVYHDPVRDSRKISDFDVRSWRPGLRERYERAMAAEAMAETILASHGGGGNWAEALALTEAALDALDAAAEEDCERALLHFLWQWAGFLGLQPELNRCAACGATSGAAADNTFWYSAHDGGLLCTACTGEYADLLRINPGCRRWLEMTGPLAPALVGRYSMDRQSFREAKALATGILACAFGRRLASWDW